MQESSRVPFQDAPEKVSSVSYFSHSKEDDEDMVQFTHVPASYFSIDTLKAKGPRKNTDVGQHHDSSRKMAAERFVCSRGG